MAQFIRTLRFHSFPVIRLSNTSLWQRIRMALGLIFFKLYDPRDCEVIFRNLYLTDDGDASIASSDGASKIL